MGQGITLELQFPIDKCRADFLINECLIVEIDGAAYHTSKEAVARDTRRDKYIRRQGVSYSAHSRDVPSLSLCCYNQ